MRQRRICGLHKRVLRCSWGASQMHSATKRVFGCVAAFNLNPTWAYFVRTYQMRGTFRSHKRFKVCAFSTADDGHFVWQYAIFPSYHCIYILWKVRNCSLQKDRTASRQGWAKKNNKSWAKRSGDPVLWSYSLRTRPSPEGHAEARTRSRPIKWPVIVPVTHSCQCKNQILFCQN